MDILERAQIEIECGKLALLYGAYADKCDHKGLASLFSRDGIYLRPGVSQDALIGRESIHAMFRDREPKLVRHIVTNVLVDVIDGTHACGTSYLTVLYSDGGIRPPQASSALYVGECTDEYVKTKEGWKIAKRDGALILHIIGN